MSSKELPKSYNPADYEDQIYRQWEQSGYFNPDKLSGKPYSIMMPPPNVTGVLHLGHALENSLMDLMARYQRMKSRKVLLLPGTDHAAVATQAKVEKLLVEQGIKNPREELGRDKLLEKIKEFSETSKEIILKQIRKLGTSCDWSRLAYTFDETRNRAVNEVFVKMYNDGLIYRGYRVVNWSVKGQSTCSDDELVYLKRKVNFYTFRYAKNFPMAISTSRPETKLGDTAVAVNPGDKRYKKYIGREYEIKNFGNSVDLKIKIIADEKVDMNFGTGAVGVTPAHSAVDFEMYEKEKAKGEPINLLQIIGIDGRLTNQAGGDYMNLPVSAAREKIVSWLAKNNLLEKVEEIEQNVGTSDRFGDIVEALPMTQWFVNVNKIIPGRGKSLKDLMKEAVTIGHQGDKRQKINITPGRFNKIYLNWIDNLRDWCISRQIWWGHRIPVWYFNQDSKKTKKQESKVLITYFVHGTTLDNEAGKSSGHFDVGLSELGVKQSKKLAELIKDREFDVVFTSDLKRAVESTKLAFGDRRNSGTGRKIKIITDKRLRECDYGQLTSKSEKQVLAREDDFIDKPFPGGESYQDVENRMRSFLKDLFNKYQGKKIAIMAHKGPQLALEVILNNKGWQQALAEDWRKKKAWRPGWKYELAELKPKLWQLKIYGQDIFEALKNGSKTIETRAGRARGEGKYWGDFKPGDIIQFSLADEKTDLIVSSVEPVKKAVKQVSRFKNIEQMFEDYEPNQDYSGKSIKEIKQWWAKRPALAKRIKQYGIWAIELSEADEQEIYVGVEPPKGDNWRQDEDTLDTWFSSGLWTFSTLNWPNKTGDLKMFHPTSWMQMGYEILFFWMARMILMSTYALDQIPFKDVYIHGMLRDELGKKFSKSAGTSVDPLEIIKQYGADALRFSLLSGVTPGNDQRFYEEKIEGARNLVNKLWNVARYIITNYKLSGYARSGKARRITNRELKQKDFTLADFWILAKMRDLILQVAEDLDNYRFSQAAEKLKKFTWDDLADWYLEVCKFEKNFSKDQILSTILNDLLKLWHPFMPFVTEAIWSKMGNKQLLIEKFPIQGYYLEILSDFYREYPYFEMTIKNIIIAIRNARSVHKIEPSKKIKAIIYAKHEAYKKVIEEQKTLIQRLRTGLSELEVKIGGGKISHAIYARVGGIEIYLMVPDFDFNRERERLNKEIKSQQERIENLERRLANKEFTAKAPVEIVQKEREKLKLWQEELKRLREQLKSLR